MKSVVGKIYMSMHNYELIFEEWLSSISGMLMEFIYKNSEVPNRWIIGTNVYCFD